MSEEREHEGRGNDVERTGRDRPGSADGGGADARGEDTSGRRADVGVGDGIGHGDGPDLFALTDRSGSLYLFEGPRVVPDRWIRTDGPVEVVE